MSIRDTVETPPDQISTTFTVTFPRITPSPEALFSHFRRDADFYRSIYDVTRQAIPVDIAASIDKGHAWPLGFGPTDSPEDRATRIRSNGIVELVFNLEDDKQSPSRQARPFLLETSADHLYDTPEHELPQAMLRITPSQAIRSILLAQAVNDDGSPVHHTYDVHVISDEELTGETWHMLTRFLDLYTDHIQRRIKDDAKHAQTTTKS